ncbi:polysaccharide pyruvyl transferase family protein [Pseudohongiella sp. O18]|uniref:polysaccharide pyruvyl transferase family protein n=1 Tax=Pseudohongiella sp. O18 TaxID=2904248 RepID=UPI001F195105|nr:polysaccharide pyruvyl transferase family protein [Pseudohongiella sp. O18]
MRQINLSYFNKPDLPNFGDDLSPKIVQQLTGLKVTHTNPSAADLIAIGSILDFWNSSTKFYLRKIKDRLPGGQRLAIWGSGLMKPKNLKLPPCNVLALRGPLSKKYAGIIDAEVVLADPGILAHQLVDKVTKSENVGIVPHYVDKNDRVIKALRKLPGYKVIDVERTCELVCKEIASCNLILSSSLHGLVVADAFGIPNARLALSQKIIGGDFKFHDYALGVERNEIPTFAPASIADIRSIVRRIKDQPSMAGHEVIEAKSYELRTKLQQWVELIHRTG